MWLGEDNTMQGFGAAERHRRSALSVGGGDRWTGQRGRLLAARARPRRAGALRAQRGAVPRRDRGGPGREHVSVGAGRGRARQHVRFLEENQELAKKAMPLARMAAPFVPGGSAALTAATPFLEKVGVAGPDGLGALYAAPDGSMYQVQGVDAGDDLDGFGDDDLNGLR